jgi:hypothetical protein
MEFAGRRTFGYKQNSSHQSGIKYANSNISLYLAVVLFEEVYIFVSYSLFLRAYFG